MGEEETAESIATVERHRSLFAPRSPLLLSVPLVAAVERQGQQKRPRIVSKETYEGQIALDCRI